MFPADKVIEVSRLEKEISGIEAEIKKETDKPKKLRNMEKVHSLDSKIQGRPNQPGLSEKLNEVKALVSKAITRPHRQN